MNTKNVWSRNAALSLYFGAVTMALGAPGELDPTFGTNGLVRIDETGDAAAAVFVQPDGRVLVGRTNTSNRDDLSVLRLNADGTLDASFATGGRTVFDVADFHSRTFSVLAQSDGTVLAGGLIKPDNCSPCIWWSEPLAVARFLADGRIDTSFGDAGIARLNFRTSYRDATQAAQALLQQRDGKIVAAGTAAYDHSWAWGYGPEYYQPDMVLARFDAAGNLDPSFGDNGRVAIDPSAGGRSTSEYGQSELHGLTQQPDGKLVGAGSAGADMAVVRLTADGALDQSFGEGGVVRIPLGPDGAFASAAAVAVQPDGKIVIGGTLRFLCDLDDPACAEIVDAVLVRLTPAGGLDATFGTGGVVTFDAYGSRTVIAPGGLVVEPAGTIVAGGDSGFVADSDSGFVDGVRHGFIARFTTSGALDTSFGNAGITLIDVGRNATASYAEMRGMARTPSGAIVAALSAFSPYSSIVVAQLAPAGGGPGTIGLVQTDVTADQGSSATFVVRRAGGSSGAVSVDYSTFVEPGSAAVDYARLAGTLTWPDRDTSDREVEVFTGDLNSSANPGLRFGLSNPGGGATLAGATGRVGITAMNDNAGVLQFEFVDLTVAESDIRSELRVTRTGGSNGPVSVHFGSYGLTATEDWDYSLTLGTLLGRHAAFEDWDYSSLEGTLRWGHGDTSPRNIRVGIYIDGQAEADERFRVVLSRPTGGATLGALSVAEVTIDESLAVPPIISGGGASSLVNGSAAPSGGGGATGVLEVLMLGCTLLASLFKVHTSPRRRPSAKLKSLESASPFARYGGPVGQFLESLAGFAQADDTIVTVDGAGRLFFQSPASGCVGNGTFARRPPYYVFDDYVFDVHLLIANCNASYASLNGVFEGLATITRDNLDFCRERLLMSLSTPVGSAPRPAFTMLGSDPYYCGCGWCY
jgi:uncharacterized delta-60 repeat protein